MTTRAFRAPGRVNLMGDHTDYNGGLVLPLAIDRECVVTVEPRDDGRLMARSGQRPGLLDVAAGGLIDIVEPDWGRFVVASVAAVRERGGHLDGVDVDVTSTVPTGSGLSSSSALATALVVGLSDLGGIGLAGLDLALVAQVAERAATGVDGGLMDQLAAVFGRRDHALLIDCRTNSCEPVALPPELAVLVVHSGVPRTLRETPYARRRAECEAIAARLGVATLREVALDDVQDEPRARHVVTENERVLAMAAALRTGDAGALSALLLASHASLRDDFEASTPELDCLVHLLVDAGALGARLTGAGFGGCVVALVPAPAVADVAREVERGYRDRTNLTATSFVVHAVDGAGPVR